MSFQKDKMHPTNEIITFIYLYGTSSIKELAIKRATEALYPKKFQNECLCT